MTGSPLHALHGVRRRGLARRPPLHAPAAAGAGAAHGLVALGEARAEIDALNVYPVPDGDTGTNLYLTVESAVEALGAESDDARRARRAARVVARGALLGARGNSGVILSQLLRGRLRGPRRTPTRRGPAPTAAGSPCARPPSRLRRRRAARSRARCSRWPGPRPTAAAAVAVATTWSPWSWPRPTRARTPWPARPTSSRCCDGPGSSTPAGAGSWSCSTPGRASVTGVRRPGDRPRQAHLPVADRGATARSRPGGPAFEVMYLLEADGEPSPCCAPTLARPGRLPARRRGRRPVERPRPRRRRGRRHRGRRSRPDGRTGSSSRTSATRRECAVTHRPGGGHGVVASRRARGWPRCSSAAGAVVVAARAGARAVDRGSCSTRDRRAYRRRRGRRAAARPRPRRGRRGRGRGGPRRRPAGRGHPDPRDGPGRCPRSRSTTRAAASTTTSSR